MGALMSVPAEPVTRRRSWSRTEPAAILGVARHISRELRNGLSGPGVRAAAGGVGRLLDAPGGGLADLSGLPVGAGAPPPGDAAAGLVDRVLHTEPGPGRPPLVALPLHV